MAAVTDRERAIDTLQRLYDYARIEDEIATMQSEQAREVKDFRAMDRHAAYASAMQKIQQRVNSYARNLYMHDVTTAKEATILGGIMTEVTASEVGEKAKSVFELMERMRGSRAFGSVVGTDILITIERVNEDSERPAWWPDEWKWPPISQEERNAIGENARLHNEACDSERCEDDDFGKFVDGMQHR